MNKTPLTPELEMVFNSLGSLKSHFEDPAVQEVMINGHDDVFVERAGVIERVDVRLSEQQVMAAITVLASRANKELRAGTKDSILNERWEGVRVCAVVPPVSLHGPVMAIRKHSSITFTLDDYVSNGVMEIRTKEKLQQIIKSKKNVLIVGGTSSGKTTFLKALMLEIDPADRILTIEDLPELSIQSPNRVQLETREASGITYTELVKTALRMRPDRIILGEVRDGAALDLLNAANTGHDGCLATLHANSSLEGLSRFEDLIMQAGGRIPLASIQQRISTTFHNVIFMARRNGKRRLIELLEMTGFDRTNGQYHFNYIHQE
jgi:pilus assembly protein CpaF